MAERQYSNGRATLMSHRDTINRSKTPFDRISLNFCLDSFLYTIVGYTLTESGGRVQQPNR